MSSCQLFFGPDHKTRAEAEADDTPVLELRHVTDTVQAPKKLLVGDDVCLRGAHMPTLANVGQRSALATIFAEWQ
jgi:hypothetical protein